MRRNLPLLLAGLAAVVVAGAVVFAATRPPGATTSRSHGPRTAPPSAASTTPPGAPRSGPPLALGTVGDASFPEGDPCPAGATCTQHLVTCPGVREPARVSVAFAPPSGPLRGMAALFSGGGGRQWWGDEGPTGDFLDRVRGAGLAVVQVRWKDEWLTSAPGEQAGPERLACRSATLIRWIHDHLYTPLGVSRQGSGRCGFCLTGSSGGASQIAYALAFYGLDSIVDGLMPSGGPPHASLAAGCLRDPAQQDWWYEGSSVGAIDASWGFRGGGGPCETHDPGWTEAWTRSSVDTGGIDFAYPATRVVVILGELDRVAPHAEAWAGRLHDASTNVSVETVPGMGHSIQASPDGLDVLLRSLTA